jgi:hypothetical protein
MLSSGPAPHPRRGGSKIANVFSVAIDFIVFVDLSLDPARRAVADSPQPIVWISRRSIRAVIRLVLE